MTTDIRKIKQLVSIMQATELAEIEIKEGDTSVRITRGTTHVHPAPDMLTHPRKIVVTDAPKAEDTQDIASNQQIIRSPMVGTAYLAPSPGAKPFAAVGQKVNKGDTVCLIEAMKMFNHIEAESSGVISRVLVDNASPVEFEQPLFYID